MDVLHIIQQLLHNLIQKCIYYLNRTTLVVLRQVIGIKYLNKMSTYHLACGDSEITWVG